MALIKRINGFHIYSRQIKRDWVNKELIITNTYFCTIRLTNKTVLKSDSLQEIIDFCNSKEAAELVQSS